MTKFTICQSYGRRCNTPHKLCVAVYCSVRADILQFFWQSRDTSLLQLWCYHTLQYTATHCNTPQHRTIELTFKHLSQSCRTPYSRLRYCNTLQRSATPCTTPQNTTTQDHRAEMCSRWVKWRNESFAATHCNTLQHITATHCNTLQHITATHCNTLAELRPKSFATSIQM